jgi:hypothetical protein
MKSRLLKVLAASYIATLMSACGTEQTRVKYPEIAEGIRTSKSFIHIDNPNVVTIDNEKTETIPYEKLNNMLKDIKYIPLISKEPIGEFRKILVYKEHIYILDAFIAEKIFIFNMKGEIIKIMDYKGGGPEEYRGLMDITISLKDDYLVITDRLEPRILYFSLDGEFVKKTPAIFNTTVEIIDNKVLNQLNPGQSYDDNTNYHLVVTAGDSIIRKGFPFYPLQMDAIFSPPFRHNYKNELLFCPYYCDTVYKIINDSAYTAKYIIRHKKSIWEKHNEGINNNDYDRLIVYSNYTVLGKPVLETENFVYYSIEAKIQIDDKYYRHDYPYWFNKKTGISFSFENPKQGEPICHFIPPPMAIYGNYYAGIIPLEGIEHNRQVIEVTEKAGIFMYKNGELRDMLMNENPDLEAILVLYEFKDS